MIRHSSIASLSREHHGALILARLLQKNAPAYKNLPTDLKGKAAYAISKFQNELSAHFLAEEVSLLERVRGVNKYIDILIEEIYIEHKQLRSCFELIQHSNNLEEDLNSLGCALEKHIRKEERVLFPLIQDHCSEDLLNHIQHLLSEKILP
jgi:hemerythrin-like domain-containing protein